MSAALPLPAAIITDVHIGAHDWLRDDFFRWLEDLPLNYTLVINGDLIDRKLSQLNQDNLNDLQRVLDEGTRRNVVWVLGNHDTHLDQLDLTHITTTKQIVITHRLVVMHGDDLSAFMDRFPWVGPILRSVMRLRRTLGMRMIATSRYARRWQWAYRAFMARVIHNAVQAAADAQVPAIAFGHTHNPLDIEVKSVRCINTGSWRERPLLWLEVTEYSMILRNLDNRIFNPNTNQETTDYPYVTSIE